MTTIAALNVRLGMDASNFSQGVNLARGEVAKVTQIMRQSVPNTERLKSSLDLLNRSFSDTGKQTKQYANAVDFLNKKYGETEKAIGTQNRLIEGAKRLAAAWLGFQGAKSIVTIAAEIENASVQFEVLTGSAQAAQNILAEMRTFAAASPLSLSAVQKSAQVLMSFGTATDQVMGKVRLLGDITGGNQFRFEMLSLAYAQASAAGRLMGQDLLQMVNAGFNPLLEISDMTGESMLQLKKRMEAGEISIQMVDAAMARATGQGGRFAGMTDKMSKTASGAYSQMLSAVQELAGTIGEDFLPYLAATANAIEKIVRSIMAFYNGMTATQKSILAGVVTFISLAAVIAAASTALAVFTAATKAASIGQAILLSLSGPKGWAMLAAGAVAAGVAIYGIYKAYNQVNEAAKQTDQQAQVMKGTFASLAASVDSAISASIDADRRRKKEFSDSLAALGTYSETMAGLQQEIIKLKYTEDELYEIRLRSQGLNDVQVAQVKVLRDQVKELERKKQLGEEFAKSQENALAAAKQFFDAEKRAEEEKRQRAIQGPGTAEAGSSEAAKIIAEAFNRDQQAKAGKPKEPGQKEFIAKAQELLIAEAENRKKQEELMRAMKKATDTMLDTRAKLFRN
jgi:membrane protein implicated in regulation of membrane protease activity